jgi:hypothetical protein
MLPGRVSSLLRRGHRLSVAFPSLVLEPPRVRMAQNDYSRSLRSRRSRAGPFVPDICLFRRLQRTAGAADSYGR